MLQNSCSAVTGSPSASQICRTVARLSSQILRDCSNGRWNAWYSSGDAPRPVPNSTRPPERTSSVATRSAVRTGCWKGSRTTPSPSRIRLVIRDSAPSTMSGDEECENPRVK